MKTFANQPTEDQYLTLPFFIAQEVITQMKKSKKNVIHLITNELHNGVLKTTIKYHVK